METIEPARAPLCSLSPHVRRAAGAVVGRPAELAVLEQELGAARARFSCVTVEGEPGIGKTRLLIAAEEMASIYGFVPIAVAADEEIRGPFLVARSIFAAPEAREVAQGSPAAESLARAYDAVTGHDDAGLESLPPDQKLLRAFDLGSVALTTLSSLRPIALLIDDLQWADEDSLRMLRYVARTAADRPIFLMASIRPNEMAQVNEAVTLLADLERMGLVRRLRLGRFGQVETLDMLRQVLGGDVRAPAAATIHAQSEGVPFIVEELVRAYRDNGMIQQMDGVWTLASNVERLLPSSVRTLIERRAARLPEATRAALSDAAVLGRNFSLRDLTAVRAQIGDEAGEPSEALSPAVEAGLLVQHPEDAAADYSFTHEQVRHATAGQLPAARRRAIHAAIVEMLTAHGDPPAESLPILAGHALAAGLTDKSATYSIEAARVALEARAPEEVLRLVEQALPVVSTPPERVALLSLRDGALDMLRLPGERLQGLTEMAALAGALGDPSLTTDIELRRAAAMRASEEFDHAADIARRARDDAARREDHAAELAACLELGQALLRAEIGEGFMSSGSDIDLDGAAEAYARAAEIAEALGDERAIAHTNRELAVICASRMRAWVGERLQAGEHFEIIARISSGESIEQLIASLPIATHFEEASERFKRALEIYDRLGDRRGAMSSIIGMAYMSWGPDIAIVGTAKRIEEIRRLATRMQSLTHESIRERAEVQMLYGVHVFARTHVSPDLALERGRDAWEAARRIGDRQIEFSAAGGVALTHLQLGEVEQAQEWLDRAAEAAAAAPTPVRARQLATWRGTAAAIGGDAAGTREHFERAVRLATDSGRVAPRCEALAAQATWSAWLGVQTGDDELIALAERSAAEAKSLAPMLPGHPLWGAEADGALARIEMARGNLTEAAMLGGAAIQAFMESVREDLHLHMLLPAARAVLAAGPDEMKGMVQGVLGMMLPILARRILDEDVRVRWFRGPIGRELTDVTGSFDPMAVGGGESAVDPEDRKLLSLLIEGHTNREIAEQTGRSEQEVTRELEMLYARLGVSSRSEATTFAVLGRVT